MSNLDQVITTGIFIDGQSRAADDGGVYDIFNPARPDALVGRAALATRSDVDSAVQAAHRAFPAWADLGFAARAGILRSVAEQLVSDEEDVKYRSRLFTRNRSRRLLRPHGDSVSPGA